MKPRLFHASTERHERGSFIEPLTDRSMLTDGTPLVGAETDRVRAMAFALLDRDHSHGIAVGTINPLSPEPFRYLIVDDQGVILGQPGGYLHEVDTTHFELMTDNHNQEKWMSTKPAEVISEPVPITPEAAMKEGVQIFVISDPEVAKVFRNNRDSHHMLLTQAIKDRTIEWLNQTQGINPLRLPPLPSGTSADAKPALGS